MNIKRLISLFLCAGLMLSCAREIAFDEEDNAPLRDGYRWLELQLSMESSKTNISGSGSTKNIEWTQGDKIDFFWGSGSDEKTTITLKVGGPAANLRVQIPETVTGVYAAYPSGSATFSEGTLSFEMPGVESGEFSKVNFMASKIVADSENGKKTAVFRSVVSFLKFTVSDPNAQKIEIRARAEENPVLRGTLPVTFDSGNNIQIGDVSNTHQTYTMNIGGAGDFYAPILPGKLYADGFELNYYVNNLNTKYYDVDFDFKLDRGYIATFGTVETLFKANAIHEYYVTVSGAGNKDGSSWANAMGKDEFKEKITRQVDSLTTDSEKKSREDYLKNALFKIEGGTYDFGALVELGFTNHCKKYINFTFDGGYYNGAKDVQNHPTVFDGGNTHRLFQLARYADLAVMDCTFSNSYGTGGGQAAIRMASKYSKLNLSGCRLENNVNTATAATINVGYGTATLNGCTFSGNSATYGAAINVDNGASGVIDLTGEVVISSCTFDGNSATGDGNSAGGALKLASGGPVSVTGCEFYNNESKYGGAVHAGGANSTFTNCIFGSPDNGNTATGSGARGGAVRCSGDSGNHVFSNCTFSSNEGNYGGAIFMENFSGTVTVNGGSFTANKTTSSTGMGGGIYQSSGSLSVEGADFDGNRAYNGGAFGSTAGTSQFINCNFGKLTRNVADNNGGCFCFNSSAAPVFTGCYISGAGYRAGGLRTNDSAHPSFTNCQFVNCSSDEGGCVHTDNTSNPTFSNCTFDDCSSKNGGCVFVTDTSYPTFSGCLFQECSVSVANQKLGGAVRINSTECHPSFDTCKFENCEAYRGGAVYSDCAYTSGSIDFNKCEFTGCYASDEGGCVNMRSSAPVTYNFTDCSFHDNNSPWGALYCNNGNSSYRTTVNVTGGDFTRNIGQKLNNTSYNNGAALYPSTRATFNVSGVRVEGNVADNGPAVFLAAETAICNCEDCEFIDNEAKTNGGVIFANANTTQFYCNSSVFDNNKAKAGAVYYNGNDGFKAYFNACAFKENNWSDDYGAMIKIAESKSNNVLCLNNCSGNHNYSNGSDKSGQQCTWINLPTNNGVKFVIANTSFIGNLQDKNGNATNGTLSGSGPGFIRIDNKGGATSVNLYMVNNILMKWDDITNYGVASTIDSYAAQYSNYNKGQCKNISGKNDPADYFGTGGRLPKHFGGLAWDNDNNLWAWNGANSGSKYLGATADINAAIRAADTGFYNWLISVGAISSDGTTAVDARGTTRGSYSWPGSYDKGDKTGPNN
ncbi:MAG: hypothetical protein MJY55_01835 [Bacteroidales bacterium]|nr:hypothetical protein [Bacteroidales bacterium]